MSCLQAASGNRIHRPIGISPLTRGALLLHTWIWGVAEQCSSFRSFQGTDSRQGYPTRAVCTSCTLSIPLLSTHGRIDLFLFAEVCPHFSVWSTFSFVCPIPWTCVQSKSQPSSQVYDSQCGHLSDWVQEATGTTNSPAPAIGFDEVKILWMWFPTLAPKLESAGNPSSMLAPCGVHTSHRLFLQHQILCLPLARVFFLFFALDPVEQDSSTPPALSPGEKSDCFSFTNRKCSISVFYYKILSDFVLPFLSALPSCPRSHLPVVQPFSRSCMNALDSSHLPPSRAAEDSFFLSDIKSILL